MKNSKINSFIYFLIGGIVGFIINFTWSLEQLLITFSSGGLFYFVMGIIWSKRNKTLKDLSLFLLFWYIIILIISASILNYSWDLPVLLFVCIVSFVTGYFVFRYWNVKKNGKYLLIGYLIFFSSWLYFFIPWVTFQQNDFIQPKNLKPNYNMSVIHKKDSIVSNKSLIGKVVLLDFWYVHCGVCLRQYPKMENIYMHFKQDTNVKIFMVNSGIDSLNEVNDFIKKRKIIIPNLYDKNSSLTKQLKIDKFPVYYLIDQEGEVKEVHLGFSKDENSIFEEKTIEKIENLLLHK